MALALRASGFPALPSLGKWPLAGQGMDLSVVSWFMDAVGAEERERLWGHSRTLGHPQSVTPESHRDPMDTSLPSSSGSGIQAIPRNVSPLEKATGMRHLLRGSCVPLGKDSLHPAPFSANIPDPGILPCWGFTNPTSINIPKKSGIFCTLSDPHHRILPKSWFNPHSCFPAL